MLMISMVRKLQLVVACFAVLVVLPTSANSKPNERDNQRPMAQQGFLYGVGVTAGQEIYKGYGHRIVPIPVLGYQNNKLAIFGPFVRYNLLKNDNFSFSANLSPRFQGFDADDSQIFVGMDKRKSSVDVGISARWSHDLVNIFVDAKKDAFSRSKGTELTFGLSKRLALGPVFFEPSLSLSYLDESLVNYYYGVRTHEVRAERSFYQGRSAINQALGLSISTPIFFNGYTRLSVEYKRFDREIYQSPLVDQNSAVSARLIFSRFF